MLNLVLNSIQYRFNILISSGEVLIKSISYETLKSETLNLIQGMVQGDIQALFPNSGIQVAIA